MDNLETCEICGDPTGRAGKGEDLIYAEWAITPPALPSRKEGTEAGPLCIKCYDCLNIVGLLRDET
uniref:Uncharacterized protein n=1 Tax=viral metagenome TaxID=1070528 RepID=A0A6M3J0X2_9ZZZZ